MIASDLISSSIYPAVPTDSVSKLLGIMNQDYLRHLPLVADNKLIGVISEDELLDMDENQDLTNYQPATQPASVNLKDHFFEIIKKMAVQKLSILPVVNDDDNYEGAITMEDLLAYYASTVSVIESGGIIVLKVLKFNYSLAEIARIVESSNALVLGTFLSDHPTDNTILVSLKLNRNELQSVIQNFERFDYEVYASFTESDETHFLKERYDSLMNYLKI